MKILITGASGFIGSFIVEEALRRGFETWAAVRKSSSKAFLQDERIHLIALNLSDEEQLKEQLYSAAGAFEIEDSSLVQRLKEAVRQLDKAAAFIPSLEGLSGRLESARLELDDSESSFDSDNPLLNELYDFTKYTVEPKAENGIGNARNRSCTVWV